MVKFCLGFYEFIILVLVRICFLFEGLVGEELVFKFLGLFENLFSGRLFLMSFFYLVFFFISKLRRLSNKMIEVVICFI